MSKILITGSSGFLASNFIRKATYEGLKHSFASIDNGSCGNIQDNLYFNKNNSFHVGNVCDESFLNLIFEIEKPDIVLHCAELSSISKSITNTSLVLKNNVLGISNLLEMCVKHKTNKFIYLSDNSVYGDNRLSDSIPTEEDKLLSNNPLTSSKISCESLVKNFSDLYKIKSLVLRPCNVYGPRQSTDKFIPKIIKSLLDFSPMEVYGNGSNLRDWMYVGDFSSILVKMLDLLTKEEENNQYFDIFNVSSGHQFSNVEIAQFVANTVNNGFNAIKFIDDKSYNAMNLSIDNSKIKLFGYENITKFRTGIKATVDWYLNNKWFLREK